MKKILCTLLCILILGSFLVLPVSGEDTLIEKVNITIETPVIGNTPQYQPKISPKECELYAIEPVSWYDRDTKAFMKPGEKFQEGHAYTVSVWISAKSGSKFHVDAYDNIHTTVNINGYAAKVIKANGQDPEEVIEVLYTYGTLVSIHTCKPSLVKRVEPTCTQDGREAYFACDCGMNYADARGEESISLNSWGIIPATGHTVSDWRTTGAYHYTVCTVCGDMLDQEDHKGGKATCVEKGKCTVCGYEYLEENENHTPDTSKWIDSTLMYHFHKCKLCGAQCDTEDHRWSPTYLYQDKTGHAWICADCKAISKIEKHKPGAGATETTPQTCKDCGYVITPAKGHEHDLTKAPQTPATCLEEGNIEYYFCTGCNDCFTDGEGKNKIPETMSVAVGALGHTPSDVWGVDEQFHWRVCTTCNQVLEETKMLHDPEENCATCGYSPDAPLPTEPEQTEDEPVRIVVPEETAKPRKKLDIKAVVLIGVVSFAIAITATVIILKKGRKKP